jgi:hypothetical protein
MIPQRRFYGWLGAVPALLLWERGAPAADASRPVSVWYRSSEGCPDGQAFVERLHELGRTAALANVGDRVDFVVTLAMRPASSSSAGRLERQTERGTVAIREVESPQCADVAEALALSLELTLEPTPDAAGSTAAAPEPAALGTATAGPAAAAPAADRIAPQAEQRPPSSALRLGAQAGVASGLAPAPAFSGGLFAELGASEWPAAGRLTLHAAAGQGTVDQVSVSVLVLAARLDGCAWEWSAGRWSLAPCLGFDLGLLRASSSGARGNSDQGAWAAGLALLRARIALSAALAPELQVAGVVPLTRYAMGAPDGDDLFQVSAVGLELSLGVRWAP